MIKIARRFREIIEKGPSDVPDYAWLTFAVCALGEKPRPPSRANFRAISVDQFQNGDWISFTPAGPTRESSHPP